MYNIIRPDGRDENLQAIITGEATVFNYRLRGIILRDQTTTSASAAAVRLKFDRRRQYDSLLARRVKKLTKRKKRASNSYLYCTDTPVCISLSLSLYVYLYCFVFVFFSHSLSLDDGAQVRNKL